MNVYFFKTLQLDPNGMQDRKFNVLIFEKKVTGIFFIFREAHELCHYIRAHLFIASVTC